MEAARLRRVVDETAPDKVPLFCPDEDGFDFRFDDGNVLGHPGKNKKLRP